MLGHTNPSLITEEGENQWSVFKYLKLDVLKCILNAPLLHRNINIFGYVSLEYMCTTHNQYISFQGLGTYSILGSNTLIRTAAIPVGFV
jgi:hypothetical protein